MKPDEKGRRKPVATRSTPLSTKSDTLISAIGEQADRDLLSHMGVPMGEDGWPALDKSGETGVEGVFLAGDAMRLVLPALSAL